MRSTPRAQLPTPTRRQDARNLGIGEHLRRRLVAAAIRDGRLLTDEVARLHVLSEAAATAYELGDSTTADDVADEVLERLGGRPCPTHLVIAASRAGRIDKARRPLRTRTSVGGGRRILGRDPEAVHYSDLARTAVASRLWTEVDEFVAAMPIDGRADLLAELATQVAEDDAGRARRLVVRGLLTDLTPRLLSAATRLDHRVGPVAIEWFVREAQSATLSPAE